MMYNLGMKPPPFKRIQFYYRTDTKPIIGWGKRLTLLLQKHSPQSHLLPDNAIPQKRSLAPQLLIVLGGDGTILEASQKFERWNPLIFGLNFGKIGFLASARLPRDFRRSLLAVIKGNYRATPRMLIRGVVVRNKKRIFEGYALNDFAIENLLGMVDIRVEVEEHPVQFIHGTGVLVSTATGSTAYNLSAHGPIVMPDIKCLIVTELLDHSIPTPSLIIKNNRTITLTIEDFRRRGRFLIAKTGEPVDVILAADAERIVALKKGDRIIIRRSNRLLRFVELEKSYFFKSLQEKFAFR